jgi:hypothetical protein
MSEMSLRSISDNDETEGVRGDVGDGDAAEDVFVLRGV